MKLEGAGAQDGERGDRGDRGTQPLLALEGIEFSYGAVRVLFGIDLQVAPGEMLALLGTNGAGKSTALKVAAGLAAPSAGRVLFDGQDVTAEGVVERVERGLVMVPGGRAVFPDLTVRENLEVGAYSLRRDQARTAERIELSLAAFPALKERLGVQAGVLSGGEQQQVALAKAFLLEPRLLCIDELSLGLAPVIVEGLLEAVRAVARAGTAVVLVEQSLNVAASLCERAVFLEKGEVRFEGRTAELLERNDVARAVFLGGHAGELVGEVAS